jgi:putative transposase
MGYYTWLVYYIHLNPVKAGLCTSFEQWKWSSYSALVGERSTNLLREEIIIWFGGKNELIEFHNNNLKEYETQDEFVRNFILRQRLL